MKKVNRSIFLGLGLALIFYTIMFVITHTTWETITETPGTGDGLFSSKQISENLNIIHNNNMILFESVVIFIGGLLSGLAFFKD